MIKYTDTKVVMSEIPDEITLAINLSNCPCHCKGCHSPYLAEDIGEELTIERLVELVVANEGITCVAFMGGDNDPERVALLAKLVKEQLELKSCWYSGRDDISKDIDLLSFNYIKVGHYDEDYGPITNPNTNQVLFQVFKGEYCTILEDITFKFWKHEN